MKKVVFAFILSFCTTAFSMTTQGWDIKIDSIQTREKFFLTEDVETYTGDMIVSELERKPTENHLFVQVDLTVQKNEADEDTFNSAELELTIQDNKFERINDDTFLSDYSIKPFTRLKIKKGVHSGTVLFEIPKNLSDLPKVILYQGLKIN